MKKELLDTTAFSSFFIRIPCKTNTIKSDQCKTGASPAAGPHYIKFSRAHNKIMSAAFISSDAKVRGIGGIMLNKRTAAFCDSVLELPSAHRLEQ
jgi:hypothetical protein